MMKKPLEFTAGFVIFDVGGDRRRTSTVCGAVNKKKATQLRATLYY